MRAGIDPLWQDNLIELCERKSATRDRTKSEPPIGLETLLVQENTLYVQITLPNLTNYRI